jgi:hypothetical protein
LSDFDVNNKIRKIEEEIFEQSNVVQREKKERNACDTAFNLKREKVSKRNC